VTEPAARSGSCSLHHQHCACRASTRRVMLSDGASAAHHVLPAGGRLGHPATQYCHCTSAFARTALHELGHTLLRAPAAPRLMCQQGCHRQRQRGDSPVVETKVGGLWIGFRVVTRDAPPGGSCPGRSAGRASGCRGSGPGRPPAAGCAATPASPAGQCLQYRRDVSKHMRDCPHIQPLNPEP